MRAQRVARRQCGSGCFCRMSQGRHGRTIARALGRAALLLGFALALTTFAVPEPAGAWWPGHAYHPAYAGGYGGAVAPWVLSPYQRPRADYRYSVPPGAPLSYDDPGSGVTYCLSQTTGFYFVCAYAPPVGVAMAPIPPPPGSIPPGEATAAPASGVLLFRLPQDARVAIDGVPIGLSEGVGIHSLSPGPHRVVLHVSGKETAHTVTVRSHRVFMVTTAGIVATEP
jgi:hypothetical protein